MGERMCRVQFDPGGRAVEVLPGTLLVEAAGRAGLALDTPCGGGGTCGKCLVRIRHAGPPVETEEKNLTPEQLAAGWRLACRRRVLRDEVVHVPDSSLFGGGHQICTDHETGAAGGWDPEVRQAPVTLSRPGLEDGTPDLPRMDAALRGSGAMDPALPPLAAAPDTLNRLVAALRDGGRAGTAVFRGNTLLDFHPGMDTAHSFGMAFDIGTTTLAGALLDLRDGAERAVASCLNPQTLHGDDVLSRIALASRGAGELRLLRDTVLDAVGELARELCRNAGVVPESVHFAAFAGNTTMEHLLCGIDPSPLGMVPFVPVFGDELDLSARELRLPVHPEARALVFPIIGGFVGGDTVAGLLATELAAREGVTLFVDIGTNGEIVVAHGEKLLAASTAAGPAFEGARISCGMRAATGAVEKVLIDGGVRLGVIGGGDPAGLCGSGLIDLCGQLLKAGLLQPDGRLPAPDELPPDTPPEVAAHFMRDADGAPFFRLGGGDSAVFGLTQRDVRELQLAAGAIRAGITILLRQAGLSVDDVTRVLVAGGFGSFIRRDNAQRVGLLPPELPHDRIQFVGNASLAGAKWAVLSRQARARAGEIARNTRHIELGSDPDFAMEFAMAMYFPG